MNKYIEKICNDEIIKQIKPFLKDVQCYVVGGYVRDILTENNSPDRDLIVCAENVEDFSKKLAEKLNARFIELDSENKIYRLVFPDKVNYIDITKPVEDDFEKDIKRRDLTINAVAFDLNDNKFVDLVGGMEDIKNGKIKGISEKNFEDDPLRLLRVFRFFSKTGFEIVPELLTLVKKLCGRINEPAKERINIELLKMFEGKYCDKALQLMDDCGLLVELFPVFNDVKKIPLNSHHHLDLFHHSIETVRQIQLIYENSIDEVKEYLNVQKYAGVKEVAFLKLSGFLHDIGKPECWTIDEDTQRHRFIKHDEVGSKAVVPILRELKFSKKQIEYVSILIKYHIYPSGMISAPDVTEKAVMKYYRKMDGYVIDNIILAMADRLSARGEAITEETVENNINALTRLLNNYLECRKNIKPLEKLLDGIEIMELLNIKQGKELGKIISELKEAQLSGIVNDKNEAVRFILNLKK